MAEINGGSLRYTAEMDISGLKSALKDGNKGIVGLSQVVNKLGDSFDKTFGATKENVKVQKDVILDLEKQYKDLQKQIDGMAPGRAQLAIMGEAASIAKEIELEKKALVELESYVDQNAIKHESLRQKLTGVKNEMLELATSGQKDSSRYLELTQKADEYEKAIKELNGELKALGGNPGLNLFAESLGLASSGMAIFQGLSALSGNENERLEQIMVKLQATMSVAIGVQQLQNSLTKESGILQSVMRVQTLARAKAETIAAANIGRTTIAQRFFNAVAKANPYVLLATALITVVGAYAIFSSKTQKAAKDQEAINKATADGAAENIVKYKQLQVQWNSLANDFKAKKKFVEENKDKFNELGVEVSNVNEAQKFLVDQAKNVVGALMLQAEAAAYAQIATEKYKEAILADKEIEKFDKDWKEAGFFEKIGLGIKASVSNLDEKKGERLRNEADKDVDTQFKKLVEGQAKMDKAAREFEDKLKSKTKQKAVKTSKEKAEEFLPEGSVAEIQRRLSEIDKALSKSNNDKLTENLKVKRIATAKELAEAEKKIQILSLQEQFDDSQKLWDAYYSTVETLGKNVADKIYGDLINADASQFDALVKMQQELQEKAGQNDGKGNPIITQEEKEILVEVSQIINDMLGNQSQLDVFKQKVSDTLSSYTNDIDKLRYLNDLDKNTLPGADGKKAFISEALRGEAERQKEIYQTFLNEHRDFEEQKTIITEKYEAIRRKIINDSSLSSTQKNSALVAAGEQLAEEFSQAFINKITNNPDYRTAFANFEAQTLQSLTQLRNRLRLELDNLMKSGNSTPEAVEKLKQEIEVLNGVITQKNPFKRISELLDEIKDKSLEPAERLKKLGELGGIMQGISGQLTGSISDIENLMGDLGISLDNGFGDALDKMKGVLQGIGQMGEGLAMMAKGDPVSIITGGIKAIGGLVKSVSSLFNNDRKKERNIKQWAAAVEDLKQKYEDLQRAVNKALGEDSYKQQQAQIANLRAQQAYLQRMINEESGKKKADGGKIQEWRSQINAINGQIDDIYTNMAQQISGTNAKDLASQLADALIEAYGKGEDAATAYGKVADDVMRNAVKNALKMKLLEEPMQKIIDQLIENMGFKPDGSGSFDGLTDAEREQIKQKMATASNNYMQALSAYEGLFGDAASNATSIEGAVKGVTEETAGIIAGQMNAIRIMQAESLQVNKLNQDILRNQLLQLAQIEINTRYLKGIYEGIQSLRDNYGFRGSGIV